MTNTRQHHRQEKEKQANNKETNMKKEAKQAKTIATSSQHNSRTNEKQDKTMNNGANTMDKTRSTVSCRAPPENPAGEGGAKLLKFILTFVYKNALFALGGHRAVLDGRRLLQRQWAPIQRAILLKTRSFERDGSV